MTARPLFVALLFAAPAAFADDPIRADLDKAKAAHAKELAGLHEQLLADIDAVIRKERDAGVGIDYLLKERKGFAENGVVPLLPKLLPASRTYQAGKEKADGALEQAYADAIRAAATAAKSELAIALRSELRAMRKDREAAARGDRDEPPGKKDDGRAPARTGKPAKADAAAAESNLVALYRFYDTNRAEHLYTHEQTELDEWRRTPGYKEETVVGYVSTASLPDTRRLWRALRKDGKHLYYLQAPAGAKDIKIEELLIYVWTKKGDGRVPVHGCCLPDGADMFLDRDPKVTKQATDETFSGIGVKRSVYPSAFYLHEKPTEAKPGAADK